MKRYLSVLLSVLMLMTMLPLGALTASAAGEYFTITENNRNLFVNVDQEIALSDISVNLEGVAVEGNKVIWTSSDAEVLIGGGNLTVTAKGTYVLDVEDEEGRYGTVTVIAKNADESEYVLYEENFDSIENGALPEGWSIASNLDLAAEGAAVHATYVPQPQVIDGVLYVGNGIVDKNTYVLLPEYLDVFGDYQVEVNLKQSYTRNNMRYASVMTRVQRNEDGSVADAYNFMFRRCINTGGGLELFANGGGSVKSVKGNVLMNAGAIRAWDTSTAETWQSEGYDMTMIATATGSDLKMDMYLSYLQETFGGDMGPTGGGEDWANNRLKEDMPSPLHTASTESWASQLEVGGVGLRTNGCQIAVDSIKVSIPASILAGNPDKYEKSELDPSLAVYQSQKIGVMSDIHLNVGSTAADYALKAALTSMKEQGVSAVLMNGDLVNTGVAEEYEKLISIWNEVFPDPETAPVRLTITGNHEFEGVYFRGETYEQVLQTYLDAFGYEEANFHEVVNGIHIIGINSESHVVDGKYTLETMAYLEEQLAIAAEADPYAPIIVMCHQTLAGTTYGSEWGSSGTGSLYEVLRYYPQVVYLAGHSHFDTTNEKSIMQKDFTCIDLPSMQYTSVENGNGGSSAACYTYQNYTILDINGESKTLDVYRMKSYDKGDGNHTYETVQIKDAWTLSLPLSKKNFTYTAARAEDRVAPTFAEDAAITLGEPTSSSISIKFPAASHDDYVHAYNVTVTDTAGETLVSKYFVSDFYELGNKKTEYEMDLEGLPSNTKCVVNVTAMESFGKVSEAISAEFTTEAISTPSVSYNRADFLDVNTAVGFVDSSPYRRAYNLYVRSHPIKLLFDEELGRQVAFMKGWVNYPVSQGNLKEITDAFTVELGFKTPAEAITAGQCLFGNPESGGLTVEFTKDGVFQVGAFVQNAEGKGGYVYVQAPELALDTWYHITYVFDGQKSYLYLDGELVGEKDSVGTIKYNSAVNWLTIGANVNAAGNAAYTYQGHISVARVYTQAMDAAAAAAAYAYYLNDNAYNTVYQKQLALKNLVNLDEEDAAAVAELIAILDEGLADPALTAEDAELVALLINAYLDELAVKYGDETIGWTLFEDEFNDFTKVHTSDAYNGLQWENNAEIKKTLVSKQNNASNYSMVYKLPAAVRRVELDALGVSVYDKDYFEDDFTIYVSEDGENWIYVPATISDPVTNSLSSYWREATLTSDVTGEYNYVKIQLNMFGTAIDEEGNEVSRVNWAAVMDGVRIWTEELIIDTVYGDLNVDGIVNLQDAALLQRYLNDWDVEVDLTAADFDADGEINNKDLVALIRYLNGWGEPERPDDDLQACPHEYDDEYDPECNLCKEIREVPERPEIPVGPDPLENPYDPLDNLDVATEAVGLQHFPNNPESGLSCALRASGAAESYLIYKNEGHVATAITVGVQAREEFTVAGFANDLAVYGRAADGEWVALDFTASAYRNLTGTVPTLKGADATVVVPEGITEVKVALINGIAWTFGLDYVDIVWQKPTAVKVSDPLDNLTVATEAVGLQHFPNNPESGLSCALRASGAAESYLIYKNEGHVATAITVGVQAREEFTAAGFANDLAVYGLNADGEWVALSFTASAYRDLTGTVATLKGADVTVDVPEGITEVKVALINGIAWTFGLDYVDITWDVASTFVEVNDSLDNLTVATEAVGLQHFPNNPESGLSCALRASTASDSYLLYKNEGYVATAITVGVQAREEFTAAGFANDLAVYGLNADGEWVALSFTASAYRDLTGTIATLKGADVTVDVPAGITEVKVALINGIAWTFGLDYVNIVWDIA